MELQEGVQRWIVDISQWHPSPQYFSFAMSFLPQHEHSSITKSASTLTLYAHACHLLYFWFVKMEDKKRALVSRLLQYALIHQVLGIPFSEIVIRRTIEGKPYLENDKLNMRFPNFNFNASHHGDYVGIASEPIFLVGLDIVSLSVPGKETVPEFIQNFVSYFSSLEWNNVTKAGSCDEMLNVFYRYWCLKEAFVKATGIGVGYRLDRVEFHHHRWTNIFVKIDGKDLKDWRFWLLELGGTHLISVARGHPRDAAENYKKSLKQKEFCEKDYHLGLHLPDSSFLLQTIEELIAIFLKEFQFTMDIQQRCLTQENVERY